MNGWANFISVVALAAFGIVGLLVRQYEITIGAIGGLAGVTNISSHRNPAP
ncbi:MAG: hypothetical protein ACRDL8_00380 [Solirubrobacteraceae bacterium]